MLLMATVCAGALQAEVFLLGPRIGSRAPRETFAAVCGGRDLMTEPVIFNGVATEQRVLLLEQPLTDVLTDLRLRFADLAVWNVSGGGVVLRWPVGSGRHERVLLVGGGDLGSVTTVFVMELPDVMPPPPVWAEGLPMVPGATAAEVVEFPGRGSQMVTFSGGVDAAPGIDRSLRAAGFLPLGSDRSGSGGMYLAADGNAVVTVSVRPDGNGVMFRSPRDKGGRP